MDSVALKKYGVNKIEYQLIKHKVKRKQRSAKVSKRFSTKTWMVVCIAAALVLGFAGKWVFDNNFAFAKSETVYFENTMVNGYDISSLTQNQAYLKIQPILKNEIEENKITYSVDGNEYMLSLVDLDIENDLENVLCQIIEYQQSGNVFEKYQKQKDTEAYGAEYSTSLVYEQNNIKETAEETALPLMVAPTEPQFIFDADAQDDYIIWSDSVSGYEVDVNSFVEKIIAAIQTENYDVGELELNKIAPTNTKQDMQDSIVKISEFSTDVLWTKEGREDKLYNMDFLAQKLNGSVVEPGENWSLNDIAGERNEENGWVLAPAIWSGSMVEEYGGGICQVATTVYNAVLLAELDIVERHAHSYPSSYVDIGMDATVDYGVKDLIFKNSLQDDVYIVVKCDEQSKTVTAMVFGPKPQHDYQVVVRATLSQSDIQPQDEPQYIAVSDGFAPDGAYIEPGETYTYIRPKTGSRYKTYLYYYDQDYDIEEDSPYCWIGYEKGDNLSGEKYEVMFVDSKTGQDIKNIMTYYPPQNGKYYYNPN